MPAYQGSGGQPSCIGHPPVSLEMVLWQVSVRFSVTMTCRIICLTYTRSPSPYRLFCLVGLPREGEQSLFAPHQVITQVQHFTGCEANQHPGSVLVKKPVPKVALVRSAQHHRREGDNCGAGGRVWCQVSVNNKNKTWGDSGLRNLFSKIFPILLPSAGMKKAIPLLKRAGNWNQAADSVWMSWHLTVYVPSLHERMNILCCATRSFATANDC